MKTENQFPQKTEGHHCQGVGELPDRDLARDDEAACQRCFEYSISVPVKKKQSIPNTRIRNAHTCARTITKHVAHRKRFGVLVDVRLLPVALR
jgi:hypothetical protein